MVEIATARGRRERCCIGNDVVDAGASERHEHFRESSLEQAADARWQRRHLTSREWNTLSALNAGGPRRFQAFWSFFAAKEAAHKAFAQAGVDTPPGWYWALEVNLACRHVIHLPTGAQADLVRLDCSNNYVHCLALFRPAAPACGSPTSWRDSCGGLLWSVEPKDGAEDSSDAVRKKLIGRLAKDAPGGTGASSWTVGSRHGLPCLLCQGIALDWSVTLAHCGRFVAYACLVNPR